MSSLTPSEKIYDEQISPLMQQIIEIAKQNKIPMFATFALGEDPEQDEQPLFCTTSVPKNADGEEDETIIKCLRVTMDHWEAVNPWDHIRTLLSKYGA